MSEVLLYSGGMDSLIAWYYLNKPETLFVDLGHRYTEKEQEAIRLLPPRPKIYHTHYGQYFEVESAWIPGRNLLLGMYAAGAGYDRIWLVSQAGEQNIPDRTPAFFVETSEILSFHFERQIQFENPFPSMYKHEMVAWYIKQGLPVEDITSVSLSCYSAEVGHCGECTACWRKYIALAYNGIECEFLFEKDVRVWGEVNYRPRLDGYDNERSMAMRKVMGW